MINGLTAALVEEGQLAGQLVVRLPSLEPIAMVIKQFTQQVTVGLIIFCTTRTKGCPTAGQLAGIDRS